MRSYSRGCKQYTVGHFELTIWKHGHSKILVCVLLTRYLWQKGRYYDNKANYIYILGFACAIMLGIGEAALFSGGIGVHILIGTLLLLANRSDQAAEVLSVPEIPAAADAGDEV